MFDEFDDEDPILQRLFNSRQWRELESRVDRMIDVMQRAFGVDDNDNQYDEGMDFPQEVDQDYEGGFSDGIYDDEPESEYGSAELPRMPGRATPDMDVIDKAKVMDGKRPTRMSRKYQVPLNPQAASLYADLRASGVADNVAAYMANQQAKKYARKVGATVEQEIDSPDDEYNIEQQNGIYEEWKASHKKATGQTPSRPISVAELTGKDEPVSPQEASDLATYRYLQRKRARGCC